MWWSQKGPSFLVSHKDLCYDLSPQIRCTSWISLVIIVTLFACTAQRLVSSRRPTRYASEASCNAIIAPLWNLMFILLQGASLTIRWRFLFLLFSALLLLLQLCQRFLLLWLCSNVLRLLGNVVRVYPRIVQGLTFLLV